MKKQTLIYHTAPTILPTTTEEGFTAPVGFGGQFGLAFEGKDLSIYGLNGSTWTLVYTYSSGDEVKIIDINYSRLYVKSNTGSEETVRTSFFSSSRFDTYQAPRVVSVDGFKLYDLSEVPVYTQGDQNKMLTVMSDGSLSWLLANESFVIGEEPPVIQPTIVGLEDDINLVLMNGANYSNGELTLVRSNSQYAYLAENDNYDFTGTTMTISGKFNMNSGPSLGNQVLISKHTGYIDWDGYVIVMMQNSDFRYYLAINGNNNNNQHNTPVVVNTNQWYSFSLVIRPDRNMSLWFDGINIDNRTVSEYPANTIQPLIFGALYTNQAPPSGPYINHFDGSLKDFKIHKRGLTEQEIVNLHNGIEVS